MGFHDFALARAFVVDAAEVEDAVDDYAAEFAFVGLTNLIGVGGNGFERNEHVAVDLAAAGVVEGDDVGEVVVLQKLPIHLQNFFIAAEDITERADHAIVISGHAFDPLFERR